MCGLVLAMALVAGLILGAAPARTVRADSGIVFVGTPGTSAPPATLGPYAMTPFPPDGRPVTLVSDVMGPTGALGFDQGLRHNRVGSSWATWSHGYTGDVYNGSGTQVTMSLPTGTYGFYFYVEPDLYEAYAITATAQDGTSSGPVSVVGRSGARYFGFYSTGAALTSITVSSSENFAIGEFGIYGGPPAPPNWDCARVDVAVKIYGGWDGIPVNSYVGGTAQETLYTARDALGEPAVLWTFYPTARQAWNLSVVPQLPAGLAPARWQYKLVRIEMPRSGTKVENPASPAITIACGSEYVFYFQLIDTGALPK